MKKYAIVADVTKTQIFKQLQELLETTNKTEAQLELAIQPLIDLTNEADVFLQGISVKYFDGNKPKTAKVGISFKSQVDDLEGSINLPYIDCDDITSREILNALDVSEHGIQIVKIDTNEVKWQAKA